MNEEQRNIHQQEANEFTYEMNAYKKCILEIKSRIYLLKERLAIGSTDKTKRVDFEIICLQFRSIFELIYLSTLAANQKAYTKGHDKLKEEWSRFRIAEFLKRENPNYYPQPVTVAITPEGNKINFGMTYLEREYLTEEELVRIYDICNGYIHPKNPFADENSYEIWDDFPKWLHKIIHLLAAHVVVLLNQDRRLLTQIDFYKPVGEDDVFMMYLVTETKTIHK